MEVLSAAEHERLLVCEANLTRHFAEVGEALREIRDDRLYRVTIAHVQGVVNEALHVKPLPTTKEAKRQRRWPPPGAGWLCDESSPYFTWITKGLPLSPT